MASDPALKQTLRRWTLILGVAQVLFGCLVGFTPPTAVPWFRGIVMAHIEYTANGVLTVTLGFLLAEMELGASAMKAWFATVQLGTWTNGAAGLVTAWSGQSTQLMGTLNEKFPPPVAGDNALATGLLMTCGITIVIALVLTLVGLFRAKPR